jgi:Flp pilus assembly CpaE family ATPase
LTWRTLHGAETDVIVDAGRLGMQWYPEPLLRLADLVVLVTRSDLPSLAAAKQWADRAEETRQLHPEAPPWASLVIGPGDPYSVREISAVLGVPVVDSLGLDARGARAYSLGARLARRGRLAKDLARCGHSLRQALASADQVLAPQGAASARGTGEPRAQADQVLVEQEAR